MKPLVILSAAKDLTLATDSAGDQLGPSLRSGRQDESARGAVGRFELLHALRVVDLARVDVTLGVDGDAVDPVEVTGIAAGPAEAADHLAVAATQDAQQVVLTVD